MNTYNRLSKQIDLIKAEMKRIGFWDDNVIQIDPRDCTQAFCADKLTFQQWLQFIFIPNVQEIISEKGTLPDDSQVGLQATREYNYMSIEPKALDLVTLLQSFDQLIENQK